MARTRNVELAGVEQAREAYPELVLLAQQQVGSWVLDLGLPGGKCEVEFVVASNAITLLSELGPSVPCADPGLLTRGPLECLEVGSRIEALGEGG
ncbi:unnamed protein product [Symbiodinium sp. CCMP2592]|nr:unnamed protein product [Symbiodinium sp. CCMP2592]